jgi:DHA1 family bicyclomycin/chloramphenicol resistance-like MFS transporter
MSFPTWLPFVLGLLTAIGPLATDMYLPAFDAIEANFGAPPGTAQITLSAWFAGLCVGQMTQGTLSDRFGRRRPLIVGTVLFAAACAGCALAGDITTLSVFRFLSAFGGAAGMVIPRAMVRDLAEGHAAARIMSKLMLVMGAGPILAPSLGGLLLGAGSWRLIFWVCGAYGLFCGLIAWKVLPETLPALARVRLGPGAQVSRYVHILSERGFITHALMGGFAMFGMFSYLAGSPQVFVQQFHLPPQFYGALFGVCAAGFIAASQINPSAVLRFGAYRVAKVSTKVFLLATISMFALSLTGGPGVSSVGGWVPLAVCAFFSMASQGFSTPNAVVGALQRHAAHAGSASALMGTMQFGLGAVAAALVGAFSDGSARPMGALMLLGAIGSNIAEYYRPRRS